MAWRLGCGRPGVVPDGTGVAGAVAPHAGRRAGRCTPGECPRDDATALVGRLSNTANLLSHAIHWGLTCGFGVYGHHQIRRTECQKSPPLSKTRSSNNRAATPTSPDCPT